MGDIDRCYEILEIEPGASLEEIKRAYRDLAFVWHPDRFAHNDRLQQKAQQRLTEINLAYQQLVLFLSQPEPQAIDKQFQQQPPQPPPVEKPLSKPLRRRSGKSVGRVGSQRSQTRPKAASKKIQTQNKPKSQKRFTTTQNREASRGRKPSGRSVAREARLSQKYLNLTPNRKKEFPTQYSKPPLSQKSSIFPWWPLAIAVGSYAVTGYILTKSEAPMWMLSLIWGADWLWAAILLAEGWATPRVWLAALVLAGAVGGSIAGFQAGGMVTGAIWAAVGGTLGAIASSEAESRAVAAVLAVGGVATVVGLMAGTHSGDWRKALVAAVCGGIVGLTCGLAAEAGVNSRNPIGLGGAIGLGMGAWAGVLAGAGSGALAEALRIAGLNTVSGAIAAIGIIAGVVARMVAGERSIGNGGLYTFILLVATSGFGLWLGNWLVGRSHLFN